LGGRGKDLGGKEKKKNSRSGLKREEGRYGKILQHAGPAPGGSRHKGSTM